MAKRLRILMCMLALIVLVVSQTGFADGIQEVNIRQLYLYTDVMHTYVEMNGTDGQPVTAPEAKNIYATLDNGRLGVKNVQAFAESGEGMAYIFVIDVSGSLSASQFRQLKNATVAWTEKMGEKDRMAIITFGNEAKIAQDFTNDKAAVEATLGGISNSDGQTKLYGGLEEALKLATRNDADLPKRKAILLLTDGVNEFAGGIDKETALKSAKEALIPIYSIAVGYNRTGEEFLNTLSDATNGTLYNLVQQDIDSIYNSAYERFQKAFIVDVSYPLESADGRLHQLKFTVRHGEKEASDATECVLNAPVETYAYVPINTVSAGGEEEGGNNMSPIILISIIAIALVLVAVIIFILAMMNRKPREQARPMGRASYPQYTPQNSNIPQNEPAAPVAAPPVQSGRGIAFTLHEIGGHDEKNGRIDGSLIIGRRSDCGLVIQDPEISGQHCRLSAESGSVFAEDLGSTNGTIVNGMTISGRTRLSSGDLIMLGGKEYRINF